MEPQFYKGNRDAFMEKLEPGSLALFFSGSPVRKTADEDYGYFANRNFVYLTGMEQKDTILMMEKDASGYRETLFILPPNLIEERWTGSRMKPEEIEAVSMISSFAYKETFEEELKKVLTSGRIQKVYLDIDRMEGQVVVSAADSMEAFLKQEYPSMPIENSLPIMKMLRLIKKPCEIRAMEKAQEITKAGILAMMTHSKPGMYEYQYKAEYDYALAQHGVLEAGFPSIISAGKNNFCIHYYGYRGQAMDGDIVLNDVGVRWDNELTDVSRGWPCNGKYSSRQKLLFECQYNTSEHMFSMLKPGIPMKEVDAEIRRYCFEQLKEAGVCKSFDDIGTYMWHGGAHHVGFDTHDVVSARDAIIQPGMVFCVDIGIYHEEWGIGFRLEDNCLITEDGCRNLSKDIPRTVEDIEAVMN
ncbi:aminopeptidase P N-terminal domain-containing protein [Sellimonas catena]|uniref:Xaa-Pro aminopeptidase n=1 Tax=Sellimonas catena TaxID=2994035 RepID=A0A9W6FFM5_9FIRM|nr:aminopeptidase P N-terminal domain-containing protein [Sellimonas catena]GLG90020.1 Xaa-Pro aminopeptidase [Sellimonas catena]HIV94595.1 aminopeptidase P N-terminal domain-containing protein [Candidatus Sellimonas avistercoris]